VLRGKGVPHLGERRLGHREGRRVPFDQAADFDQLGQLTAGHRRDVGAALGHELNELLRGEHQQRLADGSPRHTDPVGQVLFVDELALHARVGQHFALHELVRSLPAGRLH
jgi:hypothetical protein